jgi:hypothetical protein
MRAFLRLATVSVSSCCTVITDYVIRSLRSYNYCMNDLETLYNGGRGGGGGARPESSCSTLKGLAGPLSDPVPYLWRSHSEPMSQSSTEKKAAVAVAAAK